MKKILIAMMVLAGASACSWAGSTLYSTTVSTYAATNAALLAQVNKSKVNVKHIVITNPAAVAQTVSVYKNFTSTTAATKVFDFAVPASVGPFYPMGVNVIQDTAAGDVDSVSIPYFAIRTSTDVAASAAIVGVIYK